MPPRIPVNQPGTKPKELLVLGMLGISIIAGVLQLPSEKNEDKIVKVNQASRVGDNSDGTTIDFEK